MRITAKDVIATLLVAAIVIPYLGYLAWGEMPFIQDPRGMAAVGLVLGLAAAAVVITWALAEVARTRGSVASHGRMAHSA